MTETLPAGTSQPPLPAQTGGEVQSLPASFSPSQRAAEAIRSETNSGHSFDDYR